MQTSLEYNDLRFKIKLRSINIFVKWLQFKKQITNMQKFLYPKTPKKSNINKSTLHDQHLLKGLSPHLLTVGSSGCGKPKLQLMHSPMPSNRDLFSQLIQTQKKFNYDEYYSNYQIVEEDDSLQILDDFYVQQYTQQHDSYILDQNDEDSDENGIKKRKRKSSAQIKILKHELQNEPNWSKQRIAQMSEITGLSQSQVYKWWWDQKKKNAKYEKEINAKLYAKKKLIKKDFSKRGSKNQQDENSQDQIEQQILTKPKNFIDLQQIPETEKKVNKRLNFM